MAISSRTRYRKIKVGDRVRLLRQIETRDGTILAAGLIMEVHYKHKGLHLQTLSDKPCKTCGVGQIKRVRHVQLFDIEEV